MPSIVYRIKCRKRLRKAAGNRGVKMGGGEEAQIFI